VGTALILEETDTDRNDDGNSRFLPFMGTHIKHTQVSAIEKFQATNLVVDEEEKNLEQYTKMTKKMQLCRIIYTCLSLPVGSEICV